MRWKTYEAYPQKRERVWCGALLHQNYSLFPLSKSCFLLSDAFIHGFLLSTLTLTLTLYPLSLFTTQCFCFSLLFSLFSYVYVTLHDHIHVLIIHGLLSQIRKYLLVLKPCCVYLTFLPLLTTHY